MHCSCRVKAAIAHSWSQVKLMPVKHLIPKHEAGATECYTNLYLYTYNTQPCSERDNNFFFLIAHWPSIFPVTENAQHDPQ